ncbi:MAG: hypothetical protein QOJ13_956 [Gaiellales bacterium]|jgi:hypothetical protein|nr:hypothetical protein [Gaiellales bacterium]
MSTVAKPHRTHKVTAPLTPAEAQMLDVICLRPGCNRAEAVRRCLRLMLMSMRS